MNQIPDKSDWQVELKAILLLTALMFVIIGGLLVIGARLHVWVL